jgi:hypothetical protein
VEELNMEIKPEFTVNDLEYSKPLAVTYTWNELEAINFKFKGGWRVPSRGELIELFDNNQELREEVNIWSSSPYANDSDAWFVDFNYGVSDYFCRNNTCNVILVREISKSIEPEFVVNKLEYSEILPNTYTWDELEAKGFLFEDGWRVPSRGELTELFDNEEESMADLLLWSCSSTKYNPHLAWGVDSSSGYPEGYPRSDYYLIRLVRDIKHGN